MIDTSAFEVNVVVSDHNPEEGAVQKVSFLNNEGNVIKTFKYRTKKVKQTQEAN